MHVVDLSKPTPAPRPEKKLPEMSGEGVKRKRGQRGKDKKPRKKRGPPRKKTPLPDMRMTEELRKLRAEASRARRREQAAIDRELDLEAISRNPRRRKELREIEDELAGRPLSVAEARRVRDRLDQAGRESRAEQRNKERMRQARDLSRAERETPRSLSPYSFAEGSFRGQTPKSTTKRAERTLTPSADRFEALRELDEQLRKDLRKTPQTPRTPRPPEASSTPRSTSRRTPRSTPRSRTRPVSAPVGGGAPETSESESESRLESSPRLFTFSSEPRAVSPQGVGERFRLARLIAEKNPDHNRRDLQKLRVAELRDLARDEGVDIEGGGVPAPRLHDHVRGVTKRIMDHVDAHGKRGSAAVIKKLKAIHKDLEATLEYLHHAK